MDPPENGSDTAIHKKNSSLQVEKRGTPSHTIRAGGRAGLVLGMKEDRKIQSEQNQPTAVCVRV